MSNTQWAEFVAEYPLAANTREAWLEWDQIPPFDRDAVLEGLRKWKKSKAWTENGGRFIPTAANFLRKEIWKQTPWDQRKTGNGIDRHPPSFDSELYRKKAQDPENYIYKRR